MTDQGKYIWLWKKYLPAIFILLKKTETGTQKLQFYKYEFDKTGAKNKTGYSFSMHLAKGKPTGERPKPAASDLMTVLNENETIAQWLKDRDLQISMSKGYELTLEKV